MDMVKFEQAQSVIPRHRRFGCQAAQVLPQAFEEEMSRRDWAIIKAIYAVALSFMFAAVACIAVGMV